MPDDYDRSGAGDPQEDPADSAAPSAPPRTVRAAGGIVAFEGLVGFVFGLAVLVRTVGGHEVAGINGYATAGWFIVLFGAVLAAGTALLTGRRGGRGAGIITQVLLAPFAFSLLGQSHRIGWGIAVLVVIVPAFVLLIHPRTTAWLETARGSRAPDPEEPPDDGPDDNDGPDENDASGGRNG